MMRFKSTRQKEAYIPRQKLGQCCHPKMDWNFMEFDMIVQFHLSVTLPPSSTGKLWGPPSPNSSAGKKTAAQRKRKSEKSQESSVTLSRKNQNQPEKSPLNQRYWWYFLPWFSCHLIIWFAMIFLMIGWCLVLRPARLERAVRAQGPSTSEADFTAESDFQRFVDFQILKKYGKNMKNWEFVQRLI